jgi:7-cyano-7-deazaguanine synthase
MGVARKAVVLLSGGLDSTATLAIARERGFDAYALTFQYGQRHAAEIEAARRVAASLRVTRHVIAEIDLRLFGGSALTRSLDIPKGRSLGEIGEGIPAT